MSIVFKSLVSSALIIFALQFEISGKKLETRAEQWLTSSEVSVQLRQVAIGAIKISKDLWQKGLNWNASGSSASRISRASKEWKVEFRRKHAKVSEPESEFEE